MNFACINKPKQSAKHYVLKDPKNQNNQKKRVTKEKVEEEKHIEEV
jgi:hypothetical protein